jgi:hypothetical protein
MGKETSGYLKYRLCIPRDLRTDDDPVTPIASESQSKRGWDATIVKWRRKLHNYDGIDTSLASVFGTPTSWSLDLDAVDRDAGKVKGGHRCRTKDADLIVTAFVETVVSHFTGSVESIFGVNLIGQFASFLPRIYPNYLKVRQIPTSDKWEKRTRNASSGAIDSIAQWGPLYWFVLYDMANEATQAGVGDDFRNFFVHILPHILPCQNCKVNILAWLKEEAGSVVRSGTPFSIVFNLHSSMRRETSKPRLTPRSVRFFTEDPEWGSAIATWLLSLYYRM